MDASFTVHAILVEIPDAEQRFAAIAQPPVIARTGERRWSPDEASRRVARPASVEEKVVAVHDLVRDEKVARGSPPTCCAGRAWRSRR